MGPRRVAWRPAGSRWWRRQACDRDDRGCPWRRRSDRPDPIRRIAQPTLRSAAAETGEPPPPAEPGATSSNDLASELARGHEGEGEPVRADRLTRPETQPGPPRHAQRHRGRRLGVDTLGLGDARVRRSLAGADAGISVSRSPRTRTPDAPIAAAAALPISAARAAAHAGSRTFGAPVAAGLRLAAAAAPPPTRTARASLLMPASRACRFMRRMTSISGNERERLTCSSSALSVPGRRARRASAVRNRKPGSLRSRTTTVRCSGPTSRAQRSTRSPNWNTRSGSGSAGAVSPLPRIRRSQSSSDMSLPCWMICCHCEARTTSIGRRVTSTWIVGPTSIAMRWMASSPASARASAL